MKTASIALCALALALPIHAEQWPTAPVRVVVNAAAGGVADRAMRVLVPLLSEKLGKQFIVDNKAGGEGYIGQQEVARAKPDGQTFLFSAGTMVVVTPQLVPRADFDPRKALTPVVPTVGIPMNLLVHPSVPVQSAAELINYAKANPERLNFGSAGSGTALHIAAETFNRAAGIKMKHVPYKGAGEALKDFLGGHIEVLFDPGLAAQNVKAGNAKLLAVAGSARNSQFPNVPTMDELGIKGVDGGPYFGIYAPKGVSPEIVQRMNDAVTSALATPEVRQQLSNMNLEIAPSMAPAQFGSYLQKESDRYAKLLPELGIKPQ